MHVILYGNSVKYSSTQYSNAVLLYRVVLSSRLRVGSAVGGGGVPPLEQLCFSPSVSD